MIGQEILQQRQHKLSEVVRRSFGMSNPHSKAFATRLAEGTTLQTVLASVPFAYDTNLEDAAYQGFPTVACLGYGIGAGKITPEGIDSYLSGVRRLQRRPISGLMTFASDDVALLGIADGLAQVILTNIETVDEVRSWLIDLIDRRMGSEQWSSRMRALAGDLLDHRGRLLSAPSVSDIDSLALEEALRRTWPDAFLKVPLLTDEELTSLLRRLLTATPPETGDLEKAIIWLQALDHVVDAACKTLLPSISETARILRNIQHSLKRWRWVDKPRRKAAPVRWLIDDEYDVQALLWAVLYPIYEADLVDETYLPNWGNKQPRVDLGITSLKLIIEVKMARVPGDFKEFEGQIGEDIGLYFKDLSLFNRMLVFVYDDSDKPQPERHDAFRNALLKRDHVEDVIIIQRPSMIPDRASRT